jgi:hypothetical protein
MALPLASAAGAGAPINDADRAIARNAVVEEIGREVRSAGIPTFGAGSLALVRMEDARAHGADERLPFAGNYKELAF